jgi:hypothetical protein
MRIYINCTPCDKWVNIDIWTKHMETHHKKLWKAITDKVNGGSEVTLAKKAIKLKQGGD